LRVEKMQYRALLDGANHVRPEGRQLQMHDYHRGEIVISATLFTDAGCPWAYSANPALRVLEWRFRDQLSWQLVMIGLREEASDAATRTYDPDRALARWKVFEVRYGMPFSLEPKARAAGTGRGCRAVVAAALLDPGYEWRVFRELQIANFTGSVYLDDVESIRDALRGLEGVDADRIAGSIDDPEVLAEYERQRVQARSAAGTPSAAQDKTTVSDGAVRYTAPSVIFRRGDEVAYAGGWQPLLAYDTVLVNFAPDLERVPAPESPEPLLDFFPGGLTTAEVALVLAVGSDPVPDRVATEELLSELVAGGRATRVAVGSDAVWHRA
jgi:protein-disulfide isomerase-like protein with CxxC motif